MPNTPALDLDVLMARVRAEVEARKAQALIDAHQSAGGETASADSARRYRAGVLLALPNAEFIKESYLATLGREPQEDELTELRDRLLTGQISRFRALKDLLDTEEARQRHSKIAGLRLSEILDAIRRSAPARWLARVGQTIRTIYLLPRRIPQFLKRVDVIERTAREAAFKAEELDHKLTAASQAIQALERELARTKTATGRD
jgi:hypothetical protein